MNKNTLMFSVNDNRWNDLFPEYEKIVKSVCNAIDLSGKEISFLMTNDSEIRVLNSQYRGKDSATNVLSFESGDDVLLGDIVISFDTVLRESQVEKKTFENHLAHLVLHGILHLTGYDHVDDSDAEKMEKTEVEILKKMNIGNPYDDEKN